MMKKLDWDMCCHCVTDVCKLPYIVDMHTHGLTDEIGTELQCVILESEEYVNEKIELFAFVAYKLLNGLIDINSEEDFSVDGWTDCKFRLFHTTDHEGVDIVRIIECDMDGRFPDDDECNSAFSLQVEDIYRIDEWLDEMEVEDDNEL